MDGFVTRKSHPYRPGAAESVPCRSLSIPTAQLVIDQKLECDAGVPNMPATKMTARPSLGRKNPRTTKKVARKALQRGAHRTLSAKHKRALAEGRAMSATVDRYLAAVTTPKRRGRKVSMATLEQRLVNARARFKAAAGVEKVLAAQEIRDLQAKIAQQQSTSRVDVRSLEASFVKIAKKFGENRGIAYGAWRDAGVPAPVLKRAGVARTRG